MTMADAERAGKAGQIFPRPVMSLEYAAFYEGVQQRRITVRQCRACRAIVHPPLPGCPHCRGLEWDSLEANGRGRLHSYTIHYHPPLPGFATPHMAVLADMEEGFRLVGALYGASAESVRIDMALRLRFDTDDTGYVNYAFEPA